MDDTFAPAVANIETQQTPEPTLNIDEGVAPIAPPSEPVARSRAYKAHMGIGDVLKQDAEEIYRNIASGQESHLRESAAVEINAQAMEKRLADLKELAATKGTNLTLADVSALDTTSADPKAVIEQGYGRAYINTIRDAADRMGDSVLTGAQAEDPAAVQRYMDRGSDVLSKREYASTRAQNLESAVERNSWFTFNDPRTDTPFHVGSYDVKQLLSIGFYESVMLRGNTKETSRLGFLGNVLEAQANEIKRLPFEQFQYEFDKIADNLQKSDPILAQKWAQAVSGLSDSDKILYNVTEPINVALALPIGGSGRAVIKGIGGDQARNLGRLSPGPDGVYRPGGGTPTPGGPGAPQITSDNVGRGAMTVQEVLRESPQPPTSPAVAQAAKAIDDVLRASSSPAITKVSIAEGAGDVSEAAVQKSITSVMQPNPEVTATDTLLSIHRADTQAMRNAPGNLSREEHTRLLDAAEGFDKNAIDVLVNSSKIIRTPALAEAGFRVVADKIKDYFPGRENTIMDVDVSYDPISSTYHVQTKIGNYGAVPFTSRELAIRHAEINGYDIAGVAGRDPYKVYLPEAALMRVDYTDPDKTTKVPRAFEVLRLPDGSFKFMGEDGVEIIPSAVPSPGQIPYNLKTNKFEKPLSAQSARIEQQGLGFYVVVTKPVNETEPFVREGLIGPNQKSISNTEESRIRQAGNVLFGGGYLRNPYDTLSRSENENRAKTVFGQTKFLELVKNEISDVEDIYKGMLGDRNVLIEKPLSYTRMPTGANRIVAEQFSRALEAAQTAPDPKTKLPGYYMKTPAEIQHFWQTNFHRPASFKEQQAYLAVGRLDHFDHILRNVSVYMYKARLGVESWTFTTTKDGKSTPVATFDGVQLKRVPGNIDDIMLIHDVNGSEKYFHSMGTKAQNEFREDVIQGKYLGVEIYDPEKRPVKRQDLEGNDLRIRYVFSNGFQRKPITYDQIGYRGGGHWEYAYDHAVKQSIVRAQRVGNRVEHIYEGDSTFGFVTNRVMGEQFATAMNEIARLVKARQYKDAKDYAKTVFDIEWKQLYAGFRPSKNPITGEILPPRFSTDPRQQFRVVPTGKTIRDLDKELELKYTKIHPKTQATIETFVDGTRHGSLARNFQVAYTQPRDSYAMHEFANIGNPDKPFYQFRPAKLTDPITTLTRAMDRIINSTYMDSMKISAIEHWLQENMGLIDATMKEIRSSPFHFFNEGKLKNNPDTILQRTLAESNRYKIKQLIGTPSKVDSAIHGVKQALSDALYEMGRDSVVARLDNVIESTTSDTKKGVAKVVRAPLVAPEWMLDRINNPVDFLRGMTYHLNLGLFALKQVVVQSMAYTTIFGLSGMKNASAGSFAALMHQWSRINKSPAIIDKMDQIAVNFGWRLGEFKEAMHILDRTGFGHIGNELSLDNGLDKQSFFRNDAKGILDMGQRPFHEGNLHVRFGAWYTAFREFREKNPFLKIGPVEEGQILRRANLLNTTMTRDANTILNKGLIGVPFQFYDYMKKMADTFWGKNLGEDFTKRLVKNKDGTYREDSSSTVGKRAYIRARMFLMYAMLGGAAGAVGVSGLPGGDIIRKHALAGDLPGQTDAYVPGDKLWSTMLMEGPTSTLIAYIVGGGDPSKGIFYNLNNRFNPNGLQVLRDVVQTDPTFWKILLGAMGTTVANEVASFSGFTNAVYSMIEGDPAKEAWPLKVDDWIAPLKGVKAWSDGERLVYALSFGKWLDSHGRPVSDVSKIDAVFRTLTGLTDQRVDDMYLKTLTVKDRQAIFKKAENEYHEQRRKAEDAASANDEQQANDYNKRAFFALTSRNVPIEMWARILARDAEINKDTIAKNNEGYYLKFVPSDKQQMMRDAYRKTLK